MNKKTVLIIIVFFGILFADTIYVNSSLPYSSGNFVARKDLTIPEMYMDVKFSTGLMIMMSDMYQTTNGEGSCCLINSDKEKWFSYADSGWVDSHENIISTSNWSSITYVDTNVEFYDYQEAKFYPAHIVYEGSDVMKTGGIYFQTPAIGYDNTVLTVDSIGNYYKIQIIKLHTRGTSIIDSMSVRWAIDSCGNGIFKYDSTVGISSSPKPLTKNQNSQFKINIKNKTLSVISKQKTENLKIKVFDLMGRELILSDGRERSLNISALSSGVYFAEVAGGVGAREVFKFSIR